MCLLWIIFRDHSLTNVNTFREDSFFELFCKCMFEHDTERMITATVWRTVLMSSMERSGRTRVDDSSRILGWRYH